MMRHLTHDATKRLREFIDAKLRPDMGSPHFHLWQAVSFIEQRFNGGEPEPVYTVIPTFSRLGEEISLGFDERDFTK